MPMQSPHVTDPRPGPASKCSTSVSVCRYDPMPLTTLPWLPQQKGPASDPTGWDGAQVLNFPLLRCLAAPWVPGVGMLEAGPGVLPLRREWEARQ